MTKKQEQILQAALQLFAKEGYHATSTSRIAKVAGVSEGLIFRHFVSKEGLLRAALEKGERRVKLLFADIVLESDPKKVIRKTINMPFKIDKSDYDFWKLQFKLKWELEVSNDRKLKPLYRALSNAFRKLSYDAPELEANLLLLLVDGIGSSMLKGSAYDPHDMVELLTKKYKL